MIPWGAAGVAPLPHPGRRRPIFRRVFFLPQTGAIFRPGIPEAPGRPGRPALNTTGAAYSSGPPDSRDMRRSALSVAFPDENSLRLHGAPNYSYNRPVINYQLKPKHHDQLQRTPEAARSARAANQ